MEKEVSHTIYHKPPTGEKSSIRAGLRATKREEVAHIFYAQPLSKSYCYTLTTSSKISDGVVKTSMVSPSESTNSTSK